MLRQQFSNTLGWFTRNKSFEAWLRILIPPIVLILVAFLAFGSSKMITLGLIGLCVGVGALVLLLRHLPLGVVLLIPASLIVPFTVGTGTGTSINATILLLGLIAVAWLIDQVVIKKELRLARSVTLTPVLAFIFISFIGFLSGQIPWFPAIQGAPITSQIGGLIIFLISAAAFLIVANVIKEPRYLEYMTWLLLGIGAFYMLGRILPRPFEDFIRELFPIGSDASLFWVWLTSMAAAQALFNTRLTRNFRVALGALVIAAIYISLVKNYDWKSGWMPALVSLFVVIWIGAPRFRIFAFLGLIIVVLANFTNVTSALTGQEDYSISTRSEAWKIVLDISKVNPITGLGFANYYWYTPLYVIMGYRVKFNSHNNYLDLLAQTGALGLLVFLWLSARLGILGRDLLRIVPPGFHKAYIIGALGGLAGTLAAGMLGDWFLPFVYNVGFVGFRSSVFAWLFLGGLVVYEQLARQARSSVDFTTG